MIVDEADLELISKYTWYKTGNYWATSLGGKQIYLHRFLLNPPPDAVVDHIDGDPSNNRRSNLRVGTQADNCYNKSKTSAKRTSKYKGVSFRKSHKMFQATIMKNGLQTHLGYFLTEKEAAIAYNKAAPVYHGKFARLNIIED